MLCVVRLGGQQKGKGMVQMTKEVAGGMKNRKEDWNGSDEAQPRTWKGQEDRIGRKE